VKAPVITFYSYKGGVGRTFAMANIAALMAKWGHRVLCVDWDLEAPGLHRYFDDYRDQAPHDGLLEWVLGFGADERPDWRSHTLAMDFERDGIDGRVDLMQAGRFDGTYVKRVQSVDWKTLYTEHDLGQHIEDMRREWIDEYDYVLIDSRTGITDIGGICAAQLPDILVFLLTANRQSLDGAIDAVTRARTQRDTLPVPRGRFLTLPLPSRFDAREEYEAGQKWLDIFAEELAPFYRPWLAADVSPRDALDVLRVPYLSYWSFGERIATLHERLEDPENISYSLAMVAALLTRRLQDSSELMTDRHRFIKGRKAEEQLDFFIAYLAPDEHPARSLANKLKSAGQSVFFEADDLFPGDRWDTVPKRALARARVVLIVLSRWTRDHIVDREWDDWSYDEAMRTAAITHRTVVPVYLEYIETNWLPESISRRVGINLANEAYVSDELAKLVSLVSPSPT